MKAMEVIHPVCAGIDVHKDTAVVCIRRTRAGDEADEQVRTFATTTAALLELGDWLVEQQVPIVAMESTGVYWKPVWNLLEDRVAAQFHRIAARRGVKRATMAVAHSILCISWELLKHGQTYQDLGRDYFERTDEQRIKNNLVKRLQKLGYEVRLDKKDAA